MRRPNTRIRGLAAALGLVLAATTVLVVPASPAGAADPLPALPNEDSNGMTTTSWQPYDGSPANDWRYATATVQTSAIYPGRAPYTIHVRILIPPSYNPTRSTPYDVLYLLHGGAASYTNWTEGSKIKDVVKTTSFGGLVVMPEGGTTSYYSDWVGRSDGGFRPQWETFHIDQLLPWIDANFNTHRPGEQARRLLAGVSMGGWGAAKYAGQHPDRFMAAAAISGGYNMRSETERDIFSPHMYQAGACIMEPGLGNCPDGATRVNYYPPGWPFPDPNQEVQEDYRVNTVFGTGATFAGNNPWDLAANYGRYGTNGSKFALYSGGNTTGERDFYGMALAFHNRINAAAPNHRFCTGPGNHADWNKWNYAVKDFLKLAYGQQAPDGPCAY